MKFEEFKQRAIALLEHCPMKPSELIKATGSTNSAYNWLKRMVIQGVVIKNDDGIYLLPETIDPVVEPVEVEVVEMRMPSAAMTVEKFTAKDGHIVPKTGSVVSGDTSSALSLSPKGIKKESRLERKWEGLLSNTNKSQDFKTKYSNSIISNWTQVKKATPLITSSIFNDLDELVDLLLKQCSKQKWFNLLSDSEKSELEDDCETYLADLIWDYKLKAGVFCHEKYRLIVATRYNARTLRGESHEGAGHANKPMNEASKGLIALTESVQKLITELLEKVNKIKPSQVSESFLLDVLQEIKDIEERMKPLMDKATSAASDIKDVYRECIQSYSNAICEAVESKFPVNKLCSAQSLSLPEAK